MDRIKPSEKIDVYSIVTNKIVEQLEKGTIPWKKPWVEAGMPRNLITRRPYRGINLMLLSSLNYTQNLFLTWRQIKGVGATLKKNEKPHIVVFWRWVPANNETKQEESTDDVATKPRKIALLRYYYVYNVGQCDGILPHLFPSSDRINNPIEVCEDIVEGMPDRPPIKHQSSGAYYDPLFDYVNMPQMNSFINSESYYGTLFHELIHSTGHRSRLNRKGIEEWEPFGTRTYSIEELVAEIGACYLKSYAGIVEDNLSNNIAYLKGWLKRLKSDNKFIIYASESISKSVSVES